MDNEDQDIFQVIAEKQLALSMGDPTASMPLHHPEMLYIGCIDARLDPRKDIGIPQGKALIFRNIGAIVRPSPEIDVNAPLPNAANLLANSEVPENISLGAALEFFINHMDPPKNGKKRIVVSGHTDCGGIKCCLGHVEKNKNDHYLPRYLSALEPLTEIVRKMFAGDGELDKQKAQLELERKSVEQSIKNLRSYKVVRDAEAAGKLELHGWVIDTATKRIDELDEEKGKFEPFTETKYVNKVGGANSSFASLA